MTLTEGDGAVGAEAACRFQPQGVQDRGVIVGIRPPRAGGGGRSGTRVRPALPAPVPGHGQGNGIATDGGLRSGQPGFGHQPGGLAVDQNPPRAEITRSSPAPDSHVSARAAAAFELSVFAHASAMPRSSFMRISSRFNV